LCEKLLVGLGVSRTGHADNFEVIDLDRPDRVCDDLPRLPHLPVNHLQGSISRNSVSAEKFLDKPLS
jgi:hypothetical protein